MSLKTQCSRKSFLLIFCNILTHIHPSLLKIPREENSLQKELFIIEFLTIELLIIEFLIIELLIIKFLIKKKIAVSLHLN